MLSRRQLRSCYLFPFRFSRQTRHVALRREVLVYPRIEASDEVLEVLPLVRGEWESFVGGAAPSSIAFANT